MSKSPEYTKKYPCPHCDVTKYGTAQLLAHIRLEHTSRAPETTVRRTWNHWMLARSLVTGLVVTVIYQIAENHHHGVAYGVEHGAMAMLIYMTIILWVAIIFRR